jgi:hypothetical protein
MGFALGVVLIVVGAVFVWAVDVDVWLFSSTTTGILLMVVGALVIVWNLVVTLERTRTRRLQQNRYDSPPEQ